MLASFIIALREVLEAALVVGLVVGYLARTGQSRYRGAVYAGVGAGIAASLAGAWLFNRLAGGFTGSAEQVFEGITMLVGAALLTTVIVWMRGARAAGDLRQPLANEDGGSRGLGLFALVLVAVLREGVELMLFLAAARFVSGENSLPGAVAGVAAGAALGYAIYAGSLRLNLRTFFSVTSTILVLFAAGLVAQGVHELGEAAIVPPLIEHVWDINPAQGPDGSYPLLHENGLIGGLAKSLLGYNGDPSLADLIAWMAYLLGAALVWRRRGVRSRRLEPATPQ